MSEDIWKLARDWTLCASRDGIERSANLAAALNLAAIAEELRRLNERNDRFDTAMLDFFERLTEDPQPGPEGDGSLRSGQPEAALRCEVCGKAGHVPRCIIGPLTREQWKAHYASYYQHRMDHGGYKIEANRAAADMMRDRFGPCPEES